MKQKRSPDKPNSEGYIRICADCQSDMYWNWGGKITYFQCEKCQRIEPCANIIIERDKGTVTIEEGNKKEVLAFLPEQVEEVMAIALGKKP